LAGVTLSGSSHCCGVLVQFSLFSTAIADVVLIKKHRDSVATNRQNTDFLPRDGGSATRLSGTLDLSRPL
jgi:hypothetical protein